MKEIVTTKFKDGNYSVQITDGRIEIYVSKYSSITYENVGEAVASLAANLTLVVKAAKKHNDKLRQLREDAPGQDDEAIDLGDIPF